MKTNNVFTGIFSRPVAVAFLLLFSTFFVASLEASAAPRDVKVKKDGAPLSKDVEASLAYLFDLAHNRNAAFDPAQVASVIDFVDACEADPKDIEPKRRNARGAIMRMDIQCGLKRILEYLYNPDIPNYVIVPSVLRLSGWHKGSDILKLQSGLWDQLDSLETPLALWGKEFESNTPDSFAGAYYLYDMNRLVLLLKHNGKNVLISVTEQDGESDVGRKGAIVDDASWTYFYSGIEGLDRGLLSWMDTYMYSSASVQVFVEQEGGLWTRDVLFKWVNAGWSGLNVVKRKHIYEGAVRFSESFKTVLESDKLPPSQELAAIVKGIHTLPDEVIDEKIGVYSRSFELANKDVEVLQKEEFAKVLADGGYATVLNRDERVSILVLQKLKCLFGMDTYVNMCGTAEAVDPVEKPQAVGAQEEAVQEVSSLE